MSFSGSVGKLMMDSGLSDILKHAFGGVDKMLSGKKFPQNVRTNCPKVSMIKSVALLSPWLHQGKGLAWEQRQLLTQK